MYVQGPEQNIYGRITKVALANLSLAAFPIHGLLWTDPDLCERG